MNFTSMRAGQALARSAVLPTDSEGRKRIPLATGVLDYFPAALAAVAEVSRAGNEKHNPGEPLHWSRGKSMDHADTILRHLADRGTIDPEDGLRHSAKLAWRALALLQQELEADGAQPGRGAWFEPAPEPTTKGLTIRALMGAPMPRTVDHVLSTDKNWKSA